MTEKRPGNPTRRGFVAGAGLGLAAGAGTFAGLDKLLDGGALAKAPAQVSGRAVGTTWKIQSSWPTGAGLDTFKTWCAGIVEKTGGELAFESYGANGLVGEFQVFDALQRGQLQAMNAFTQYWSGRMPASVFLASYPLGLRQPHEWDVFYYKLGGLEIARQLFARFGMHYLGPVRHGANIIHSKKPIRSIEDFKGLRLRMPGGMIAELFQAAGARTTMLPGSEVLSALQNDLIDAADYVGPAVNRALGLHTVTKYVSMGPPGLMSIYQPVDLMDITVSMPAWLALSPRMRAFLEDEVQIYSTLHHTSVEQADQAAWNAFATDGIEVTRLGDGDLEAFTRLAVPLWFDWAGRDPEAGRVFRIHLDYMMSGSLGYVTPDMIRGYQLNG